MRLDLHNFLGCFRSHGKPAADSGFISFMLFSIRIWFFLVSFLAGVMSSENLVGATDKYADWSSIMQKPMGMLRQEILVWMDANWKLGHSTKVTTAHSHQAIFFVILWSLDREFQFVWRRNLLFMAAVVWGWNGLLSSLYNKARCLFFCTLCKYGKCRKFEIYTRT